MSCLCARVSDSSLPLGSAVQDVGGDGVTCHLAGWFRCGICAPRCLRSIVVVVVVVVVVCCGCSCSGTCRIFHFTRRRLKHARRCSLVVKGIRNPHRTTRGGEPASRGALPDPDTVRSTASMKSALKTTGLASIHCKNLTSLDDKNCDDIFIKGKW